MTETAAQILVIRGGAIGDFILTLPVLSALRRHFPQARIEVLGYPHIVQLALLGGLADGVRSIEARALAGFFARRGELDAALSEYFGSFAVILSYLYDPDQIFQENVACCSRAQFITGPHRADEATSGHATETYLHPLKRLAIFEANPVPDITIRAPSLTRQLLALHPGSGSERKNWPEEKWAALLARLATENPTRVLLVGGEAEGDRLNRLARSLPESRVDVARSLPLADLAMRLRECAAFVGHDSGISHLAAALGVPTLALWGDTSEAVWRPQGRRVTVIRDAGGLAALSVESVVGALAGLLRE